MGREWESGGQGCWQNTKGLREGEQGSGGLGGLGVHPRPPGPLSPPLGL